MKVVILTPVGPGHEKFTLDRVASITEAIGNTRRDEIGVEHFTVDDTDGELGRSKARNLLREKIPERADWVGWFDADDLMAPGALQRLREAVKAQPDLEAVWGAIWSFRGQEPPRVRPRQQYPKTFHELVRMEPTSTLQSGFFVRAAIARQEPWNEAMDAGEDFEMYLRLWRTRKCRKIMDPFMFNRRGEHSTGPRSADGRTWRREVMRLLRRAERLN